jgi:sugar lactone lactonase YvrE
VPPGNIARIAGKDTGDSGDSGAGDNGFALSAQLIGPTDMVVANDGTIYITDVFYKKVRRINPQTGVITSLSLAAKQYTGLGFDTSGRLYITNYDDNQLLRETAAGSGSFGVLAGGLNRPRDVAVDASGFAYVVNSEQSAVSPGTNAHRIMRVSSDGTSVTTFAGTTKGYSGDGGLATSAQLNVAPSPLVISSINAIYSPMGVGIITSPTGDVIFADSN